MSPAAVVVGWDGPPRSFLGRPSACRGGGPSGQQQGQPADLLMLARAAWNVKATETEDRREAEGESAVSPPRPARPTASLLPQATVSEERCRRLARLLQADEVVLGGRPFSARTCGSKWPDRP